MLLPCKNNTAYTVTKEYLDFKGLPVKEEKEFKYKITGTYKKAMVVFPDTNSWNDMRIYFDAKGELYYIEHTSSVGADRFYIDD